MAFDNRVLFMLEWPIFFDSTTHPALHTNQSNKIFAFNYC